MEGHEKEPEAPRARRGFFGRPIVRIVSVLVVAVAAGAAAWVLVDRNDTSSSPTSGPTTATSTAPATPAVRPIGPIGLSASGLRTLTSSVDQPIYWAGPKPGYVYELTRTTAGNVFIRYLPTGVKVGTKQAIYLIVATYPFRAALEGLKKLSSDRHVTIPRGGIAVVDARHATSVHLAYPDVDEQVEVYDPSPATSLRVARSGVVRPVTP